MNILLVTQLWPADDSNKFTSGVLREFAVEWSKKGHQVKVVRPHFKYEKEPFPKEEKFITGNKVQVEFVKPIRIPFLKLTYYSNKKILKKLTFKPDVVICHLYNAYFTFHRLARMLDVPLIIGIHMSDIRISKNWFHRLHQQLIFKNAAGFACRSLAYQRKFIQRFPKFEKKSFLALSGIPDLYLTHNPIIKNNDIIKFISVSSLIKRKQIDKVIKALKDLPSNISWEYYIIGTGQERDFLKSLTEKLNISEHVFFLGHLRRDNVVKKLIENDIFILPSYNETLGVAYLEAMACGCITIGSKNEGIDGIIKDEENGFLCDPFNDRSILEKLVQASALNEKSKSKILKNAKRTVSSFTIEKKSEEYINNITRLLT